LVNAGIAEAAGERLAIRHSVDLGERGDDGHLADQLNLLLGYIHRIESQRAIAHPIEKLLLGANFAVGGNAEEIVGEELVHGGDIASELRTAPLLLKRLNMIALNALGVAFGMVGLSRRWNPHAQSTTQGRANSQQNEQA